MRVVKVLEAESLKVKVENQIGPARNSWLTLMPWKYIGDW